MKDHEKSGVEPCRSAETVGKAGDDGQGALVERLRNLAKSWAGPFDEAADRIEAITRENAALRAEAAESRLSAAQEGREAVAWEYELARAYNRNSGEWCDWGPKQLSDSKPCVPEGSIRNLRPLYPAPAQPAAQMEECARWYVVNDSDWCWDSKASPEGDGAPKFVMALNPQSAAERAVMEWRQEGEVFDGAHLIVALVETVGFAAVETDSAGNDTWEPFCNISGSALASPTDADAAVGWRSMDSAPKDGTRILLRVPHPDGLIYAVEGAFCEGGWNSAYQNDVHPTHWAPKPKLLTAAKAGEDGR